MTYAQDEQSPEANQPVEGYTFQIGSSTWRITSHNEDVTIAANLYTADVVSRSNVQPPFVGRGREMVISVRRDHAMALDIIGKSNLPRLAKVTVTRMQRRSSGTLMLWTGDIQGYSTDGPYLRLRVPNATDDKFAVHLPVYTVSRTCNNALYDEQCAVDIDYPTFDNHEFMSACEVASVNGIALVVDVLLDQLSNPRPDGWAKYGMARRVSDGERRAIVEQVGVNITLDVPFSELANGDEVEVYAGCDHTAVTCRDKFDNIDNFFGAPDLPTRNVASPDGFGTIVQS